MHTNRLFVDDFHESSTSLFAIYSSIEDYRLAYFLNLELEIGLSRRQEDLDFVNTDESYSIFEYQDQKTIQTWYLVKNNYIKQISSKDNQALSLFNVDVFIQHKSYLIPEHKDANYFLKIETEGNRIDDVAITRKIIDINQVITTKRLNLIALKSKNNLIFN